ncbi:MAG: hypothetical protein KGZ65_13005 [Sphingomonadales bacterium]|nr:hypothetical protein [Sphingomonadaceae bacterium]MBS3932143.1 hypothetical protein [Sphingomonadales bacterium]
MQVDETHARKGYEFSIEQAPDAPKPRWRRGFGEGAETDRGAVHRGLGGFGIG